MLTWQVNQSTRPFFRPLATGEKAYSLVRRRENFVVQVRCQYGDFILPIAWKSRKKPVIL
jgi:hypothetical protein